MKKHLLLIFLFCLANFITLLSFAQGNGGNRYEIVGNQQPCVGSIETYTITPNPGNKVNRWDWDPPRAQAGEVAWQLISISNDQSQITVKVGDKPGTIKAKPVPGSNNTETLPVHPGQGLQIALEGPNAVCANVQQVYRLVIKNLKNGKKDNKDLTPEDLKITWLLPNGLTVMGGQNTSTLTVMPTAGFTGGNVQVSVEVPFEPNTGPNNNGKGVGRITGFCGGAASTSLLVGVGANCTPACPVSTVIIAGPVTVCAEQEDLVTYTANVTNGTPNMNYAWVVPNGWTITAGATTNEIRVRVGNMPGQVQVRVQNNCSDAAATANKIVAFGNNCGTPTSDCTTPQVSITGPAKVCASQDQAVTFSALVPNATPDMRYSWKVPSGWFISAGRGTSSITVFVGNTAGQVSVIATNNCQEMASAVRAVAFADDCVNPPVCATPQVNITGPATVCQSQKQAVTFSAGVYNATEGMIYEWSVPEGWFLNSGQGTSSIVVFVGNTVGNVSLKVTNNCGAKSSGTHTVSFRDNCGTTPPDCSTPLLNVVGPTEVCAYGDEPVVFTANVNDGSDNQEFIWTVPEDWFILAGENTNTIEVLVGFESGAVGVTVINNICGKSASNSKGVLALEDCSGLVPLPVELISFAGESTKSGVLLQWATAMEQNNEMFEVERSSDGRNFSKVGQVKGNGNSNSKRLYSLRDNRAGKGTHYYRLKQIDFNGSFEYSKIVPVNHSYSVTIGNMVVAPNPVNNGQFRLTLPQVATDARVQLLDLNGRVLYTQRLEAGVSEATFSTQSLNIRQGVYLIKLQDGDQVSQSRLIIK